MSEPPAALPEPRASTTTEAALTADVSRRIKTDSTMVYNVHQRIIVIGRDRLTLVLNRNRSRLLRVELVVSLVGLVAGLLLTLVTADFQDRWGISAAQWQTGFVLSLAISFAWLVFEFVRLACWRVTIEGLVDKIESESDRPLG